MSKTFEQNGIRFENCDCMERLRAMPDKSVDLAIVDPIYGDVKQGGYMKDNHGQRIGTGKANQRGYHNAIWMQAKTPPPNILQNCLGYQGIK